MFPAAAIWSPWHPVLGRHLGKAFPAIYPGFMMQAYDTAQVLWVLTDSKYQWCRYGKHFKERLVDLYPSQMKHIQGNHQAPSLCWYIEVIG